MVAEAARLLTESAARAYDAGGRCDLEAGMAKLYATEAVLHDLLRSADALASNLRG